MKTDMQSQIKGGVRYPAHTKVWFFSYLLMMIFSLIFPFEWLYPWMSNNEQMMMFIQSFVPAADRISEKTVFNEYSMVYVVWLAVIGVFYQCWALVIPHVSQRNKRTETKLGAIFCFIGFPVYILAINWVCLTGAGGSINSEWGDYWSFLYRDRELFTIIFLLFWTTSVATTWALRHLAMSIYRNEITIN
ncbi:MAG: hypothetical protein C9356_13645 [Oleiphilus sp.]|nr:MAG: hypothetical protein C9356_13645 [Oleiphilus sp.]